MSLTLEQIVIQEQKFQFEYFDSDVAWKLGSYLYQMAYDRDLSVAIEVYAFDQVLFSSARIGMAEIQQNIVERMRQNVLDSGHSSHYLSLLHCSGAKIKDSPGALNGKVCALGGSFPIQLRNGPLIGAITCAGLTSIDDHNLVVEALSYVTGQQALID